MAASFGYYDISARYAYIDMWSILVCPIYIYIYRLFCCYSPKKIVSWPLPKWGSPQSASHCCRGGCLKLLTSAEGRVKHPSSTTVLQPFAAKKFSAHVLRRATRNQSWAWAPLVSRKATTQGLWNLRLWGSILSLLLTGSRSRNSTPGSKGLEQTAVGSLWGWLRIWLRRWFRMTPDWRSVFSHKAMYNRLVGGLEHVLFFHILGIVTPTDYYFSEGLKPPTSIYNRGYIAVFSVMS